MNAPIVISSFAKNGRETVRVALETFKGHDLVDIRVCVPLADHAATPIPTKAGLAVNVALLPELIAALEAARAKAQELGVLKSAA